MGKSTEPLKTRQYVTAETLTTRQDVTAETLTTTLINTDKWNVNPDNSLPIRQILSVEPRLLTDKLYFPDLG